MDGLRKFTESDLRYWCQQVPLWELHEASFLLSGYCPFADDYSFYVTDRSHKIGETYFALRKCAQHEENNTKIPGISFRLVHVDANTKKTGIEWIVIAKKYGFDVTQSLLDAIAKYSINAEAPVLEKKSEAKAKKLETRERDTLHKIIIGMAVRGYGYNPKALRNSPVTEIASDLAELGIAVSDDTIRKYLVEASQLLPPEACENQ